MNITLSNSSRVVSVCTVIAFSGIFSVISAQSVDNDCSAQMKVAEQAVQANPKNAIAYYRRGLAYNCRVSQDVIVGFNKSRDSVTANTPAGSDVPAVEILKQLRVEGDSAEKSIADFSSAIKLDPKYKEAYLSRGLGYLAKGLGVNMESPEFDQLQKKALVDFNRVISLDPKNAIAYKERALIRSHFEEFDLSIADYTKAISLSPNDYKLYEYRGSAYYWKGMETFEKSDFQLSVKNLTKAISLTTDSSVLSSLYNDRADSYALLDDKVNETIDRKKADELERKP